MNISFENNINFKELIQFYSCHYPKSADVCNENYLHWILDNNPLGKSKVVLARYNEQIVGAMFLVMVKDCNNNIGYYACDVLTDREHPKLNIFVKMARFVHDYICSNRTFLIGHPNKASAPGWKRAKMAFQPHFLSYITKPKIKQVLSKRIRITSVAHIESYSTDINNLASSESFSLVKTDVSYLTWRYLQHPTKKYEIELIFKKNVLVGLLVFSRYKKVVKRLLHALARTNFENKVLGSSLLPMIYSSSTYSDQCHRFNVGSPVNYFFTSYTESIGVKGEVTYVACDI
ncbi:hypothetical protein AB4379_16110 [Vibrio breoganii]